MRHEQYSMSDSGARSSIYVLLGTILIVILWLAVARLLVPPMIEDAYHGESFAILNRVISGQDQHTVEKYQGDWRDITRLVAVTISILGAIAFLLLRPELHRLVDSYWPLAKSMEAVPCEMKTGRLILVHALLVLIVGVSTWAIARPVELWPFSPYSMYAGLSNRRSIRDFRGRRRVRDAPGDPIGKQVHSSVGRWPLA